MVQKEIADKTDCVGALVVWFEAPTGERAMELGSAFSIGPGLLVTAKHVVIHPSNEPRWKCTSIHFVMKDVLVGKHFLCFLIYSVNFVPIATSVKESDDKSPNYMCELLSILSVPGEAEKIQTSNGTKTWLTKFDVVFLAVSSNVFNRGKWCVYVQVMRVSIGAGHARIHLCS